MSHVSYNTNRKAQRASSMFPPQAKMIRSVLTTNKDAGVQPRVLATVRSIEFETLNFISARTAQQRLQREHSAGSQELHLHAPAHLHPVQQRLEQLERVRTVVAAKD